MFFKKSHRNGIYMLEGFKPLMLCACITPIANESSFVVI